MRRALPLLAALALVPALVHAQRTAPVARMAGGWQLDTLASEPMPEAMGGMAGDAPRARPEDAVGGVERRGGGRRGGGGGGGAMPAGGGMRPGARGGMGGASAPYIRALMTEFRGIPAFRLDIADTAVAISTRPEAVITWVPDGKKHQKAEMDGTLLEKLADVKGEKLLLNDGLSGGAMLTRELHLRDDGALELKLELGGSGVPRKVKRTLVYRRIEG